jgi:cytidylate kinase
MQKRIITICGLPGSGKSSTAIGVAKTLGYTHFSSGDLFRTMAKERGISVEEINHRAELEQEIDHAVDERLRRLASEDKLVIDSRMAFHWMPESFKVFLKIDPHVAAQRTFEQMRKSGRVSQNATSVEEVYKKTVERTASEIKRYTTLYGVDYTDESQFDLVVDTARYPLQEVVEKIVKEYEQRL